jgi:hypothetical protein
MYLNKKVEVAQQNKKNINGIVIQESEKSILVEDWKGEFHYIEKATSIILIIEQSISIINLISKLYKSIKSLFKSNKQ